MNKDKIPVWSLMLALVLLIAVLFSANLLLGSVSIPLDEVVNICIGNESDNRIWTNIVLKSRMPQAITALTAGAGLAVSGLLMQTVFRNPLADPSVLGVSSGASMGVAFVVLLSGALAVMALIAFVSQKVRGNVTLLIMGVMIGYIANAIIGVLKFFSVEEDIKAYVIWGLGSFSRVSGNQIMPFVCTMAVLLPLSFLLVKTLNLLLLGDSYARNLGLNLKRARLLVISCSGALVAIVTAYCGPIAFLGLAVPHLCKGLFRTSDHKVLMPASLLVGAAMALTCNIIARMPGFEGALPVNSVTALIGAPVVMSVIFKKNKGDANE